MICMCKREIWGVTPGFCKKGDFSETEKKARSNTLPAIT